MTKKTMALLLSVMLIFSLGVPRCAADAEIRTGDVEVVEANGSRTAVTTDDKYVYRATNNMRTGIFTMVVEDRSTSDVIREVEISLNALTGHAQAEQIPAAAAVVDERDTRAGYSYRIESDAPHDDWKIHCPQEIHDSMESRAVDTYYSYLPYAPANQGYLDDFRDAVKALDQSEEDAIETAGRSLLLEFLTIVIANSVGGPVVGKAAEAIIASLTGFAEYQDALRAVNDNMSACYETWRNAWRYGVDRHYG